MFIKKIGIDLGTVNTLVFIPKKGIVVNEPSLVVLDQKSKKPLAIGKEASQMIGRTPYEIQAYSPLKDGVIADYKLAQVMLNHFLNKAIGSFQFLRPDVIASVPADISSTEKRAIIEAILHVGAKNVYLVKEPLLAAIGAGIKISQPAGHMIVDIGGGTSEIATISLGAIVVAHSLKIGGIRMTEAIIEYIRKKYNLEIGFASAESIKLQLQSFSSRGNNKLADSHGKSLQQDEKTITIKGQDTIEGLPGTIEISKNEINLCFTDIFTEIAKGVKTTLQETPPEISADILEEGIIIAGGGAMIPGVAEAIHKETGLTCHIAENPLFCVINGISYALKNLDSYKKNLLAKKPEFES